jgi:hypothetical protein
MQGINIFKQYCQEHFPHFPHALLRFLWVKSSADPLDDVQIESLQIGKSAAKDAHGGQECGLSIKGKIKIQVGDRLEVFHEEVKERKVTVLR